MVESKHQWKAWLYLSPAIVLLGIFTVWPIINTVRISLLVDFQYLRTVDPSYNPDFGFQNFVKVIGAPGYLKSMFNTMLLTVLTVPLSTILALLISVALHSIKPLQRLYQTIFFLPYVTNSIAIGLVFMTMFKRVGTAFGEVGENIISNGLVNNFLGLFGIAPITWDAGGALNEANYWYSIIFAVIYIVWNALPFKILILLGGLQSVNKQYYEAAKVDGTSKARVFTRITVPLLSPMITYVVITSFISGFKEYSSLVGLFGEVGTLKVKGLNTMVGYIYQSLQIDHKEGLASAGALILFVIIFIVTMINLKVSKKKTHY